MYSILTVGQDPILLSTRAAVLRTIKADVIAAPSAGAMDLIQHNHFDAVVLCHTLSKAESSEIAEAARDRHEGVCVVQVVIGDASTCAYDEMPVHAVAEANPGDLISKVSDLITQTQIHRAQMQQSSDSPRP